MPTTPLSISLPTNHEQRKRLLDVPETQNMHAGYVNLQPGEAVDEHSTGESEEMLIPLAGCGELQVPGLDPLSIAPGRVLYNPPHTRHAVVNTGSEPLIYIYVVAGAGT